MICSSVNLNRFIVRPSFRPDSNHAWRKIRGSRQTGRPAYHPATMLKIYLYGYLNRVQSSRRLEREAGRNIELMWLAGRLAPDFKTLANFRQANGAAIRAVCSQFIGKGHIRYLHQWRSSCI
jgi:transposase